MPGQTLKSKEKGCDTSVECPSFFFTHSKSSEHNNTMITKQGRMFLAHNYLPSLRNVIFSGFEIRQEIGSNHSPMNNP